MKKMITIVEFAAFSKEAESALSSEEKDEFVNFIAQNPETGKIIPGTGGVRKVRWKSNNKGKSGGIRVIYYFYDEHAPIFLLTAYSKGVQENLTAEQKKQMYALAQILKHECRQNRREDHD